jgi:hypothetical protein
LEPNHKDEAWKVHIKAETELMERHKRLQAINADVWKSVSKNERKAAESAARNTVMVGEHAYLNTEPTNELRAIRRTVARLITASNDTLALMEQNRAKKAMGRQLSIEERRVLVRSDTVPAVPAVIFRR